LLIAGFPLLRSLESHPNKVRSSHASARLTV
jgi:hypothetical protein